MRKPRKFRFLSINELGGPPVIEVNVIEWDGIVFLNPRLARAIAKRLEEMAEYVEWKREKKR